MKSLQFKAPATIPIKIAYTSLNGPNSTKQNTMMTPMATIKTTKTMTKILK